MAVNLKFIPVEISISKEQEAELFKEFQPVLHMVSAACCNIAKEQNFTKFAYLAKALDVLLNEAHDAMCWPDHPAGSRACS
jgi:hypothetical protein